MKRAETTIVDLDGEDAAPPGHDRRRAVMLTFALCLAIGSAGVGRDGPEGTQPRGTLTTVYDRTGTKLLLDVTVLPAQGWRIAPADSTR